jgi:hypothetical protein
VYATDGYRILTPDIGTSYGFPNPPGSVTVQAESINPNQTVAIYTCVIDQGSGNIIASGIAWAAFIFQSQGG